MNHTREIIYFILIRLDLICARKKPEAKRVLSNALFCKIYFYPIPQVCLEIWTNRENYLSFIITSSEYCVVFFGREHNK